MKRRKSERGEIITAYILISWFVVGLFSAAGHKIVTDLKEENQGDRRYQQNTVLRVDYNSGNTLGTCNDNGGSYGR